MRVGYHDVVLASGVIGGAGNRASADEEPPREVAAEKLPHRSFALGPA
jgi:hypothetical protein